MHKKREMFEECWKIIQGTKDAQEPERELAKRFFKNFLCPMAVDNFLEFWRPFQYDMGESVMEYKSAR